MSSPPKRTTIMIVDDNPTNLKMLQEVMQARNYRVLVLVDSKMVFNAVTQDRPDLILLDINMPGMNGFEVCEQLKADESLREIPVIFITALAETANQVKAFAVGGVDFVTKPIQVEEVQARVETHLTICRQKRELQDSYNKLRELETLRDNLVHMIVHDMRSQLMIVLGRLNMTQKLSLPEKAASNLTSALGAANWLAEMVSSLLDVSKMEAGQMLLEMAEINLNHLVRETFQEIEPLQGQRQLNLISAGEMPALVGDTILIRRVIQNLIVNAIKFTDRETGVITVSIDGTAENTIRVSVADNGPGILPEYQEKVFDKFYQIDARKQGQARSTGLGLTFCKLAVEAHHGQIGLESQAGRGSTFWFELPAA
jgi:signal transduction histidine kinase